MIAKCFLNVDSLQNWHFSTDRYFIGFNLWIFPIFVLKTWVLSLPENILFIARNDNDPFLIFDVQANVQSLSSTNLAQHNLWTCRQLFTVRLFYMVLLIYFIILHKLSRWTKISMPREFFLEKARIAAE